MRAAAAVVSLALLVAGCATSFQRPTANQFGFAPLNYETQIREYFDNVLKDGESARYKFHEPVRAYGNKGLAYGGGVTWTGYLVDVDVNAKNSFGAYVGYQRYVVLFDGEDIRNVYKGDDAWSLALLHRF